MHGLIVPVKSSGKTLVSFRFYDVHDVLIAFVSPIISMFTVWSRRGEGRPGDQQEPGSGTGQTGQVQAPGFDNCFIVRIL